MPSCRQVYITLISITQQLQDIKNNQKQSVLPLLQDLAKSSFSLLCFFKLQEILAELHKKIGESSKSLINPFNEYHRRSIPIIIYKFGKMCLYLGKDMDNVRLVEKINHLLDNEYKEFVTDCDDQISKTILDFLRAQKQSVQKGRLN